MIAAVAALAPEQIPEIVAAVAACDGFDAGIGPHQEHDFGSVNVAGLLILWNHGGRSRPLASSR